MGKIGQLVFHSNTIYIERNPIRVTNWRYIKPLIDLDEKEKGVFEICIDISVFTVYNITLEELDKLMSKNITEMYIFKYFKNTLICSKCGGTGIIDWIDKATKSKEDVTSIAESFNYIRGPVINKLTFWNDDILYTSTPRKKLGDEFCYECHGCGIKLPSIAKNVKVLKSLKE